MNWFKKLDSFDKFFVIVALLMVVFGSILIPTSVMRHQELKTKCEQAGGVWFVPRGSANIICLTKDAILKVK